MAKYDVLVINFSRCSPTSTIASNRIAIMLTELTGGFLVDSEDSANEAMSRNWRHIFVVNGLWGFCSYRQQVLSLIDKVMGHFYWCSNDYAIKMPGPLKKKRHVRVANFDNFDAHPAHVYMNWNQITFNASSKLEPNDCPRPGLSYYGAFRQDRLPSFYRYFVKAPYDVNIWTSTKGRKHWQALDESIAVHGPLGDPMRDPNNFEASIYIGDEHSRLIYHSPANRFYELLSAGCFILFCRSTLATFMRAGVRLSQDWLVSTNGDVADALRARASLVIDQREVLFKRAPDYRLNLMEELRFFLSTQSII